jgi:hypothetical protein
MLIMHAVFLRHMSLQLLLAGKRRAKNKAAVTITTPHFQHYRVLILLLLHSPNLEAQRYTSLRLKHKLSVVLTSCGRFANGHAFTP